MINLWCIRLLSLHFPSHFKDISEFLEVSVFSCFCRAASSTWHDNRESGPAGESAREVRLSSGSRKREEEKGQKTRVGALWGLHVVRTPLCLGRAPGVKLLPWAAAGGTQAQTASVGRACISEPVWAKAGHGDTDL